MQRFDLPRAPHTVVPSRCSAQGGIGGSTGTLSIAHSAFLQFAQTAVRTDMTSYVSVSGKN